jgi:cytochrome c-type biogenesis protein
VSELAQIGWGAAAIAFVAGVVSFFSPCVAPLVPGYIGYLSGRSTGLATTGPGKPVAVEGDPQQAWRAALGPCLLFVAGFSLAFVALGAGAASFGRLIAAYRPVLETLAGIVMVAMGAFLLGWLPRPLLAALSREWRLRWPAGTGKSMRGILPGWLPRPLLATLSRGAAPVALGFVFAAGWTPCIGPILSGILLLAAQAGTLGGGVLLLAVYALGFAVPFIAVGLGWSASLHALGWLRRHGGAVQSATGVALLLMGVLYLTGQATLFASWAQALALPGPR